MKKQTRNILIGTTVLGTIALAIANKDALANFFGGEAPGSLGGQDELGEDAPLGYSGFTPEQTYDPSTFFYDPYPTPAPAPDDAGTDGTEGSDPNIDPFFVDDTSEAGTGSGGSDFGNELLAGAAFAGGAVAVEAAARGIKSKLKKPKLPEAPRLETPESRIGRARNQVPDEIAGLKGAGKKPVAPKPTSTKLKTAGRSAGRAVGKGLILGHVLGRSAEAFNEYGTAYLEPRFNAEGEYAGSTLGSTAQAVGATALVASGNIASDLFAFASGLVYRPPTNNPEYEGQQTGWFATEKEIIEGLKQPKEFLKSLVGYDAVRELVTGEKAQEEDDEVIAPESFVMTDYQSLQDQFVAQATSKYAQSSGSSSYSPTQINVQGGSTGGSSSSGSSRESYASKLYGKSYASLNEQQKQQVRASESSAAQRASRSSSSRSSSSKSSSKPAPGQKGSGVAVIKRKSGKIEYKKL